MKFNALSIVAPYGDKIANGEKTIEVRSWLPPEVPLKNVVVVQNDKLLLKEGDEDENGVALALVDFVEVKPWKESEVVAACSSGFKEGYFGWRIENMRPINPPQKAVAKRKIYQIELAPIKI